MEKIFEVESIDQMMRKYGRDPRYEGDPKRKFGRSLIANDFKDPYTNWFMRFLFARMNRYARYYHFLAKNRDNRR